MRSFFRSLSVLVLAGLSPLATAETDVNALVDSVAEAYGGSALMGITNYQITQRYIVPQTGQSWSPDLVNVGYANQELVHDMKAGNIYFENWFGGRGGSFPTLTIVKGEEAHAVNLRTGTYGEAASADPYAIAGGTMRTTDTLLVLELIKQRTKAEYLGSVNFMNRPHEMVKIPFPLSSDLTLYIDSETHLVNRMTRENPQLGLLDYVFEEHELTNGISRATNASFFVAGEPNLIGIERNIRFNSAISGDVFDMPADLKPEGARINATEMVVNRLSKNVYHIGQNSGFSIFVDTPEGVVGCGGYAGLTQRFERFQQESGSHRPLRYQVVSHHHSDHLGGMGEALDLGATLVTVTENIEPIKEASRRDIEGGRFLTMGERMTLGSDEGRVELYNVSTIHAKNYLLVYVPSTRTLFMADHFNTPYETGAPVAGLNTVSMNEALEPLDINYKKIVTAHGARVYSAGDFSASVKAYRDFDCPQDRPLCAR
jgi:glyoxylase-like metal-dependent hydrolase (beta-lactamase superfamily II)